MDSDELYKMTPSDLLLFFSHFFLGHSQILN
jgi:hypothetical protein